MTAYLKECENDIYNQHKERSKCVIKQTDRCKHRYPAFIKFSVADD